MENAVECLFALQLCSIKYTRGSMLTTDVENLGRNQKTEMKIT